jgi:hypothetical protein
MCPRLVLTVTSSGIQKVDIITRVGERAAGVDLLRRVLDGLPGLDRAVRRDERVTEVAAGR